MLVALRKATSAAVMPTRSRGHLSRLRSIDGDARCNKQIKLAAQRDELATNLTNGLAIVLAEIRDGLEVRRQLPGQPDHLDIALALPLQASARRHPIEVAIDVELEHASSGWTPTKPSLSRSSPSTNTSTARTGLSSATQSSSTAGNNVLCPRSTPS